jgi:hypothetical protein
MAKQTTPHTQTQQNADEIASELEPLRDEAAENDDAGVYAHTEGAQTGGTRAFHANEGRINRPDVQQESAALTGGTNTRTPQSDDNQGITNHSASEESARQEKVVRERPDAQAGVNQTGDLVR